MHPGTSLQTQTLELKITDAPPYTARSHIVHMHGAMTLNELKPGMEAQLVRNKAMLGSCTAAGVAGALPPCYDDDLAPTRPQHQRYS